MNKIDNETSTHNPEGAHQQQKATTESQEPEKKTNIFAILSLAFSFTILGFIFGIIALVQIGKDSSQKGKGLAIAGIIISVIIGLMIALMVIGIMTYRFNRTF